MESKKEQYIRKVQIQLDEWNSRIQQTAELARGQEGAELEKYERWIAEMREQESVALSRFETLKAAGEKNWQDHQLTVQNALERLKKTVQEAFVEVVK